MDPLPLRLFFQYLDPRWLQEDLIGSLWHLHSQPPAYNLLLGVLLKLVGEPLVPAAMQILNWIAGFCSVVAIHALLRGLEVGPRWALGIALAFILYPAAWIFECLLFYSQWELLLNVLLPLALLHSLRAPARSWIFFGLLATFVMLRAHIHLAVYAAVALAIWRHSRWDRRFGLPALLFFLPCAAWYLKNLVLFGFFGASSWLGMNLARAAVLPLGSERQLTISALAAEIPFQPLDGYTQFIHQSSAMGHPAVDEPLKLDGHSNYNHRDYIPISRAYLRDSLLAIRKYPGVYAYQMLRGVKRFFSPAEEFQFVAAQTKALAPFCLVYNAVPLGNLPGGDRIGVPAIHLTLFFGWPFCALFVLFAARNFSGSPKHAVIAFMAFLLFYQSVVVNLMEYGENSRFRYTLDALFLVLFSVAIREAWIWLKRNRSARPAPLVQ